jgi:hypothetical protein
MKKDKDLNRFGTVFSIVLFIVAGLIFVFGVVLLLLFINMANGVTGYSIYFQMVGIAELAQIVLRPLQAGLINMGIIIFVMLLVLSLLMASAGWVIRRQTNLLERIIVLEDAVQLTDRQTQGGNG